MLKDILSISGESGLFKLVAQSQKNIIVEHLESKKRIPVYQTTKVSALEDIAIYTEDEEVQLFEIFKKIYTIENKAQSTITKNSSNNEIKEYFEDVLPNFDKERVYVSDMKKVISWYNILLSTGILAEEIAAEEKLAKEEAQEKSEAKADAKTEKPAAKTQKKVTPKAVQPKQPKPSSAKKAPVTAINRKSQ